MHALRQWVRRHPVEIACVLAAAWIAWWYRRATLAAAGSFAFPLDDSYIYLTYAKQIARGHPFSYFDGSGYTTGATSMLWPVVIAPLWAIGFRGDWFAKAVFVMCAVLLGASAIVAFRLGRKTLGAVGGMAAASLVLLCGPLTWAYLSGMEVALAGTLLLASALALLQGPEKPSKKLLLLLAATMLARPEAGLAVAPVVGGLAIMNAARRRFAVAARFCAPMAAPIVVALVNRALTGHAAPNTAIVKAHFYLAGFDTVYWRAAVIDQTRALWRDFLWKVDPKTPLWAPKMLVVLWLLGAARLSYFAIRRRQGAAGVALLLLGAPAIFSAVIATSGLWRFQNYRYIAAALPPWLAVSGIALSPPARAPRPLFWAAVAAAVSLLCWSGERNLRRMGDNVRIFAQGARDANAQVVRIGHWVHDNLPPDARIALHDVGAVGYFGERPLLDVIGLITNGQAERCNHGPGARFEAFERLSPERRPTHFVYYPGWLLAGSHDLYGPTLMTAPLPPALGPQLAGGSVMEVIAARWDLLGSGEAPLSLEPGWRVVDAVDVADVDDERAHGYRADIGRRGFGDLTDGWSCYYSASQALGATGDSGVRRLADGGRTIRGPRGEHFTVTLDPTRAVRLVVRTGGPGQLPGSEVVPDPILLRVRSGRRELGQIELPAPAPRFQEAWLELPADPARPSRLTIDVAPDGVLPYRTFHWYVLSPR